MQCPACGHQNRASAQFCGNCAAPLAEDLACPRCGTSNLVNQRFCDSCGLELAEAAPRPAAADKPAGPPGSLAGGRYQMKRFLGEGGRKRVYLAYDRNLDREVAVALIKMEGLDQAGITRARREAEAMGRLGDHPHIVTAYDIGEEHGQLYIVSQYMEGGDLDDLVQRSDDRRLPVRDAVRIAGEICRALEHAHGLGVIHRDIKPKNAWLTADGTVKLGDFGLAVALDRSRITTEGMMLGTVAYMPPEQALGRSADARADLYSLGALLYELVCGRQPFIGEDAVGVISQHINTAPVRPSWLNADVSEPLEAVILKLLAKAPEQRPSSAADARQMLAEISVRDVAQAPAAQHGANPVGRLSEGAFVGRERENEQLRGSLETVISGRGRIITIAGEVGLGKTRTAAELATFAGLRGAQVLWGRCYEGEGAPAYWPWVQIIRSYVHGREPRAISSEMGSGAAAIAQVVSEVRDSLPGLPLPPDLEPEQARFRLFDSITTFLKNAAKAQPLVLVLDDLQWADKPSLLLLEFLASELRTARVLVLGTYRDAEITPEHPLWDTIGALGRYHQLYERIVLGGLSVEETRALLEATAGHELELEQHRMVEALHAATEGNPFFIEELVRHLVETGWLYRNQGRWVTDANRIEDLGLPEGVRETIGRRVGRLSEDCYRVLVVASVIGREFGLALLERVADCSGDSLLGALDEAVAARIVDELAVGRYRFSNGLTRETLHAQLTPTRRARLHHRIAEALEELCADKLEPHLAELAYHFGEGGPLGGKQKAIDYGTRAAERSMAVLAYEDALAHYARALQAVEREEPLDEAGCCELLLAVGGAAARAGEVPTARESFTRAADIARRLGRGELLARAALGHGGSWLTIGVVDETLVALLEDALDALPDDDRALRARVLARLAVELSYSDAPDARRRRTAMSEEAVEMARRIGDTAVLAAALSARHYAIWDPDHIEERLAVATEIIELGERVGEKEKALRGHHWRLGDLLELGRIDAVDREEEAYDRLAEELRQPFYRWWTPHIRAMRALLEGHFNAAETLSREAWEIGRTAQERLVTQGFGVQTFWLRRDQGRLAELEQAVKEFVEQYPAFSAWRCVLAYLYSELDLREEARAEFDRLAADDFGGLRRDGFWLVAMTMLAETCAFLGDANAASTLYELLLPYAERNAVAGHVSACNGSVSRYLGLLSATLERWEEAVRHFEAAVQAHVEMGARPLLAHTRTDYAEMLMRGRWPGERERAHELLKQALETANDLGMQGVVRRGVALRLRAQGAQAAAAGGSIDAVAASLESERPDFSPAAAPDGTVTMVFSDIESSSAMTEALGDAEWLKLLREHNALVREHLGRHGGFEVKSQGDGFMIAFSSARRALKCAVELQRAFADRRDPRFAVPLRIRIGMHSGEAIMEEDDFFGKNVILAARIAGHACGGEILVSSLVKELTESTGEFVFDEGRKVRLKGLSGTHSVFAVEWRPRAPRGAGGSQSDVPAVGAEA